MAKIYSSTVTFKSENEKDIKFLHKLFSKAESDENYSTKEICNDLKMELEDDYDLGFIYDISREASFHFSLDRETEGAPKIELFDAIAKNFTDLEYFHFVNEKGDFCEDVFQLNIFGFDDIPLSVLKFLNVDKIFFGSEDFSNENSLLEECNNLLLREFTSFEELKTFCRVMSKVTGECMKVHKFQYSQY